MLFRKKNPKHLRYNQSKTKNHPNPTLLLQILGRRSLVSKYLLQSHHHDEANDHRSVYHDHLLQYHHDVGSVSDEWLVLEEEGRLPFVDYFQGENMMSGLFTDGLLLTNMSACINKGYSLGSVWCSESLAGIYCVGLGFLTLSPCSSSALLSVPSVSLSVPCFLFV